MEELNDKFKKSAEDFSLIPSSGIWQNVELDIRRRERKKRFIIFFFLLAGILGSGIFLFRNYPAHNGSQVTQQTTHSKSVTPEGIKENTLSVKNNLAKENAPATRPVSEKINQDILQRKALSKKQFSNHESFPKIEHGSALVTQRTSTQKQIAVNKPQEALDNNLISTAIEPVRYDSLKISIIDSTQRDSLPIENEINSESAIISDTAIQNVLTAKDTIKTARHGGKWSFSFGVAPAVSYTRFNEVGDYRIIANYRDSSDKNLLAWNYHLAITYKIIPEFEVLIGAGLVNYVEQMPGREAVYRYDTTVLAGPNPVPTITVSRSYFNINNDSTGTIKNKFSWLEIPVGITYNFFPGRKLNLALRPGISFNKLLHFDGYKYNYQDRSYNKITTSDLRPWLVAYSIGVSFQYAIGKNINIEFTPCYTNFQKSIFITSYPFGQRFQQTEFQLSLRYLLK